MQVSNQEETLLRAYSQLSPVAAEQISALITRLATSHQKVDWSDEWSDSDLQEFTASSLCRLETEHSEDPR